MNSCWSLSLIIKMSRPNKPGVQTFKNILYPYTSILYPHRVAIFPIFCTKLEPKMSGANRSRALPHLRRHWPRGRGGNSGRRRARCGAGSAGGSGSSGRGGSGESGSGCRSESVSGDHAKTTTHVSLKMCVSFWVVVFLCVCFSIVCLHLMIGIWQNKTCINYQLFVSRVFWVCCISANPLLTINQTLVMFHGRRGGCVSPWHPLGQNERSW